MAENKKQHFVPQVLQRCFSIDSKTIGEYLIGEDRCFDAPIGTTAQKPYYYKVKRNGGTGTCFTEKLS